MNLFDAKKLDPEIRQIVLSLRNAGFITFTSCQAGKGHSFILPTVGIIAEHNKAKDIEDFLKSQNLSDFVIVRKKTHNKIWNELYAKETKGEYLWIQGIDLLSYEHRNRIS